MKLPPPMSRRSGVQQERLPVLPGRQTDTIVEDAPVALVNVAGVVHQLPERTGLLREPGGDLVDVAGDVDNLDAETGGLARQPLDDFRFRGQVTDFQP